MLTIPQIEALRTSNPQLYESLKRLAGASLSPNQGWSLDDQITDGADYARVVSGALTDRQIDPTKPGVLMKGSLPPSWSGSFTYISTTSSLTWSWTGLTIYRADGATTAIPDDSAAVTGLAPGTTYYFYPYWDDAASALAWVAGGAGSSGLAQSAKTNSAAQQQSLQGRVPLSQGAIVAATTTSGTGGGSGGGSGSCLRAGSMVLTRERGTVPIESCKIGEHLRCPSAAAGESWTRIIRLEVRDAETFIRLHFSNNESLDVTPHHIFTLADGSPMRAERLCLSDIFVGRFARLTLLRIEAISATAARSASVGAQHAVPGTDTWRDSSHPPQPAGNEASVGAWHAMPGTNTWRDVASSASPDRHRHPERSAPLSSSVFADSANTAAHQEGLPGRRLVEPGRSVEGPLLDVPPGNQSTTKRDPSSASRGRTLRGESQTARDSAQDDGSQFGAEVEARGIGLAKSPQATAAPMEARSASPAASPKADASPVEARGFSPAKSAPQREGLQPRASTPAAPGSSCSAGILPANLPWTSDAAPWQKVTITCEPSHQFFAGRHSASILTHNYTFSS